MSNFMETKMISFKKFREENGLADIKSKTDISGTEGEMLNDLASIFRKNSDRFKSLLKHCLRIGNLKTDEENDLKKVIGIIGHLKDKPEETGRKLRDPLDNVVVRQHNGADGSDGGNEFGS